MEAYKTVRKESVSEIVIERSRFITTVAPCDDEAAARELLLAAKKKYYSATHNCYAFVTEKGKVAKFSDDGEPGGTAGAPILSAIKNAGVTDVIVIVTRYFGGIKLGAGGLTRAYLNCAASGLKAADTVEYHLAKRFEIKLSYEEYQTFLRIKNDGTFAVENTLFDDAVTLCILVKSGAISLFSAKITDLFFGKIEIKDKGESYFAF